MFSVCSGSLHQRQKWYGKAALRKPIAISKAIGAGFCNTNRWIMHGECRSAGTNDGVEKLSTEPFSTNIGRCFRVNCFLLVAPRAFWRFTLLANATSWAFFNGIERYCNDFASTRNPHKSP